MPLEAVPDQIHSRGKGPDKQPHGRPVFLGDDITDVDGFRAIRALRDSGKIVGGFSVAVCASESLAAVIANSDFQIDGVPKMVQELTLFAAVLKQGMPA